jgi:hypothetical protein
MPVWNSRLYTRPPALLITKRAKTTLHSHQYMPSIYSDEFIHNGGCSVCCGRATQCDVVNDYRDRSVMVGPWISSGAVYVVRVSQAQAC